MLNAAVSSSLCAKTFPKSAYRWSDWLAFGFFGIHAISLSTSVPNTSSSSRILHQTSWWFPGCCQSPFDSPIATFLHSGAHARPAKAQVNYLPPWWDTQNWWSRCLLNSSFPGKLISPWSENENPDYSIKWRDWHPSKLKMNSLIIKNFHMGALFLLKRLNSYEDQPELHTSCNETKLAEYLAEGLRTLYINFLCMKNALRAVHQFVIEISRNFREQICNKKLGQCRYLINVLFERWALFLYKIPIT